LGTGWGRIDQFGLLAPYSRRPRKNPGGACIGIVTGTTGNSGIAVGGHGDKALAGIPYVAGSDYLASLLRELCARDRHSGHEERGCNV
jgi:hypothetical protein